MLTGKQKQQLDLPKQITYNRCVTGITSISIVPTASVKIRLV